MPTPINRQDISTTEDQDDIFVLATTGERLINFGALMTSGNDASPIRVAEDGVNVANFGLLTTSGDGSRGVSVGDQFGARYDNVTVINHGAITITGNFLEEGTSFLFADGVDAFGNNNQVINFGTISATGSGAGGIYTAGIDTLIVNYGRIESGFVGMFAEGAVAYWANGGSYGAPAVDGTPSHNVLINHGEIHLTGDPNGDGVGFAMMAWGAESIVRNYGTILLDGDFSFIVDGVDFGFVDGMDVAYAGSLAENYGLIHATSRNAFGMFIIDGDNLARNYGTIRIDGSSSTGIVLDGANSRGENYGTILVSDETSVGVFLGPWHTFLTGGAQFTNYGTVRTVGMAVLGGEFDDVVTNRGVLVGDVSLEAGDDTYVAGAKGQLDGVLTLGDGDDLVIVQRNSGDLVITDFLAGLGTDDVIDLSAFRFRSLEQVMARAQQSGADVIFDLGAGTELVFQNVNLGSLTADDFSLGGPGAGASAQGWGSDMRYVNDLLF